MNGHYGAIIINRAALEKLL